MYKLNDVLLSDYGIIPGRMKGEGIAVKGIFDLPKRIGKISFNWGDEDSVEPYVDSNEIFFGGRDIFFAGIILGTRPEVEANLKTLKDAIDSFYATVVFVTPYGDFCVYVKKITPKFYRDGATLIIEFREPDIDSDCNGGTPPPPPTIYYSADYSATARKNDCDTGYTGSEETLFASDPINDAFPFESILSQAAADQLAIDWVLDNVNLYANNNGTCTINPPVYWNVETSGTLQKDDCGGGFVGSFVTYTVAADSYNSLVSQAAANQLAQDDVDATLTQAYANANGYCSELPTIRKVGSLGTSSGGYRIETFEVGGAILVGAKYNITIYSHRESYTTQLGDVLADIPGELVTIINNTPPGSTGWDEFDAAPGFHASFFPPTAALVSGSIYRFTVELDYQDRVSAFITVP